MHSVVGKYFNGLKLNEIAWLKFSLLLLRSYNDYLVKTASYLKGHAYYKIFLAIL